MCGFLIFQTEFERWQKLTSCFHVSVLFEIYRGSVLLKARDGGK